MTSDLFVDAKLKIERANEHIEDFRKRVEKFAKTIPYTFSVEHDAERGYHVLTFEAGGGVPRSISLALGDALHNLRTALDYVAFEIVTRADGATNFIKFPIREDRDKLKAALTGGEMKVAGSDIIELILDVIQPYPGGNASALFVLHSLDICDKHFQLTPVFTVVSALVSGRAGLTTIENTVFMVDEGGKMRIVAQPGPFKFQGQVQPAFQVLFGKGQPFEGQAVIPTLHQLSQLISGAVHAIEQVYLARERGAGHNAATGSSEAVTPPPP